MNSDNPLKPPGDQSPAVDSNIISRPSIASIDRKLNWQAIFLVLLTCFLWGGNPVAVRYSAESLGPMTIASIRFAMATGCMYLWCRIISASVKISWKAVPWVLAGGFLLFTQIALFHVGVDRSSASHATLLINTYVFWVMIIESMILHAVPLQIHKLTGLLCAAIGTALIILTNLDATASSSGDMPTLWGDALLFASGFVLALKILLTKIAVRTINSSTFIFWHDLIGCGLLMIACLIWEPIPKLEIFDSTVILSLMYQGICVAGFCFAMQAYLLQTYSATRIAIFSFTSPIFGVLLGVSLRGDQLSAWFSMAVVMVALGIFLVNRPSRRTS